MTAHISPGHTVIEPRRLTAREAARRMGYSVKTLANWRSEGRGPRYHKQGYIVRYEAADLEDFLNQLDQEQSS
jgi:transcriptional regulator with XRE-family HTH domain